MRIKDFEKRFSGHVPGLQGAGAAFAVLVPLIYEKGEPFLLFEVRADTLNRQPGEVCFPGGRAEPGESIIDCALRETAEELSIPSSEVSLLGTPDFICNQRGFLLHPVLGVVSPAGLESMRPSPAEVAEVFTVPFAFFRAAEPEVYAYDLVPQGPEGFPYGELGIARDYPWSRGRVEVPVWRYENHVIWGMTARIVRELVK